MVLTELQKRGFSLGVISNSDGRIGSILQKCGIADVFDTIIDSHEVGVEKPDPQIFLLALDRLNTHPDQAVYVGDIYGIDVVGSERAGLRAVLLDPLCGYGEVPCRKIRHLRELLSIRGWRLGVGG
jgi:putative hydrolase of the HAD superfamily